MAQPEEEKLLDESGNYRARSVESAMAAPEFDPIDVPREEHTAPERDFEVTSDQNARDISVMRFGSFDLSDNYGNASAGWMEGAARNFVDDSFLLNIHRMWQDYSHEGTDEDKQQVLDNLDFLTEGLHGDYTADFMDVRNMDHAQKLRERIMRSEYNQTRMAGQGMFASLASGFGGYMMDPTSWVMIGAGAKVTGAVAMNGIKKGVGYKVPALATGVAWETAEEAIRGSTRLASDPTFNTDMYLSNIAASAAFGGLLGGGAIGVSNLAPRASTAMSNVSNGIVEMAQKYELDVHARTAANAFEKVYQEKGDAGILRTLKDMDTTETLREARNKAKADVEAKLREVDEMATKFGEELQDGQLDLTDIGEAFTDAAGKMEGALKRRFKDSSETISNAFEDLKARNPEVFQKVQEVVEDGVASEIDISKLSPAEMMGKLNKYKQDVADMFNKLRNEGVDEATLRTANDKMQADGRKAQGAIDDIARANNQPNGRQPRTNQGTEQRVDAAKMSESLDKFTKAGGNENALRGRINRAIGDQGSEPFTRMNDAELTESLASGVVDTITKLSQSGDPAMRPLYQRLASTLEDINNKEGISLTFYDKGKAPDWVPEGAPAAAIVEPGQPYRMAIQRGAENMEELIAHEALHLATMKNIDNPRTANQKAAVADLEAIRQHLVGMGERGELPDTWFNRYGVTDIHELTSMAMTNPQFRNELAKIEMGPRQSALSRFTNAVRKALGLTNQNMTALDRVIEATNQTMEGPTRAASVQRQVVNAVNQIKDDPVKLQRMSENIDREIIEMAQQMDAAPGTRTPEQIAAQREALLELQDQLTFHSDRAGIQEQRARTGQSEEVNEWNMVSDEFVEQMGDNRQKIVDEMNTTAQRAISNQFGRLTESMASRLMRSEVPLAQWAATHLLEMPTGTGGRVARQETAAILSEQYSAPHQVELGRAWEKLAKAHAKTEGLNPFQRLRLAKSAPSNYDKAAELSRMVYEEVNNRNLGRPSTAPQHVQEFANSLNKINDAMYDMQLKNQVHGITGDNKRTHYIQQNFTDGPIADFLESGNESQLTELISKSLQSGKDRMAQGDADALARDWMSKRKEQINKKKTEPFSVDDQVQATNDPSYTNERHFEFDLSAEVQLADGSKLSMLDIMDTDVVGQTARYAKTASGYSALSAATGGRIKGAKDIDDFLAALSNQAAESGQYVNTRDMRNVLREMVGLSFDGQMHQNIRKIRDATALAGMNGLGESQLAELGLAMNRGVSALVGFKQVLSMRTGQHNTRFRGLELTEAQKADTNFLNELEELTGLFSDMNVVERRGVHYDQRQSNGDTSLIDRFVDKITMADYIPALQHLQTKYTGYAAIRNMENQIAMAGLMQDYAKMLRTGDNFTSVDRLVDIGLMEPNGNSRFAKYFEDGTVSFKENGTISGLNIQNWSEADQQALGVALNRHTGQQVQRSFAGEMAPEMMNPVVAMMMQFKSYPLLAAEKQQGRNMKFADKEAGMGIILNAMSSGLARSVRYHSLASALPEKDREAYLERKHDPASWAQDSFEYMGIAGMIPTIQEYAGVFNMPYLGSESTPDDGLPASVTWAQNYFGMLDRNPLLTGEEQDVHRMQQGLPLGTISFVNTIAGIIRTQMEEES